MLNIVTFIVNGLKNKIKRAVFFFLKIKTTNYDLILLQETHSTHNVVNKWNKEWGNSGGIYLHGTSASKRVTIL